MVGGVVTSTLMELLVYPAIFYVWRRRSLRPHPACWRDDKQTLRALLAVSMQNSRRSLVEKMLRVIGVGSPLAGDPPGIARKRASYNLHGYGYDRGCARSRSSATAKSPPRQDRLSPPYYLNGGNRERTRLAFVKSA